MKITRIACLICCGILQKVSGQGFVNLNFEQATIIAADPSPPNYPDDVYASSGIPGWTPIGYLGPNYVSYNSLSIGATDISLCSPNPSITQFSPPPLDGQFSIVLFGGTAGPAAGASISQTGLVPANAASIRFIAESVQPFYGGPLLVSLGGQKISYSAISTGPDYTVYAGDISAFAGQIEQLTFNAPQGGNNYWELDDIQFSSATIPEPSVWSLVGIATFMFCWRLKGHN